MDLSVIIVSYNCSEYLKSSLEAVASASSKIESEVFVVDNNSADDTVEMVRKYFPGIKLIANSDNKGFSAACNQALRIASGNYLLLLNPDTLVNLDTFDKCISFMEKNKNAGALGVRMTDNNGVFLRESKRAFPDPVTAFYKLSGLGTIFPKSTRFNRYYMAGVRENEISEVEVLTGAFLFMRHEALIKAGYPDERFFLFGEDIDLSNRLLTTGFRNWYYPETSIIHFKGRSTNKAKFRSLFHFYRSMSVFVNKYYSKGARIIILPLLHMAILLRGIAAFLVLGTTFLITIFKK